MAHDNTINAIETQRRLANKGADQGRSIEYRGVSITTIVLRGTAYYAAPSLALRAKVLDDLLDLIDLDSREGDEDDDIDEDEKFAEVAWTPTDLIEAFDLDPRKSAEWLDENQKYLQEVMIMAGWDYLENEFGPRRDVY